MNSLRNQDELPVYNEPFAYYSFISNPSFQGFKTIPDPAKFVLDPYVREVMLANLKGVQVRLAMMYFNIIDDCHRVEELDLTPTGNTYARKLLALVMVSMGTEHNFLKTMLTNYSISEQRTEEKAYQEYKEDKKEEDSNKWKFLPKRRGFS